MKAIMTSRRRGLALVALSALTLLGSKASQAASSRDYPGPCQGEKTVPGTPVYLASDYHRTNPDTRIISMPDVGRLRLGISCVGTGFIVIRIGPDSALCQNFGASLMGTGPWTPTRTREMEGPIGR